MGSDLDALDAALPTSLAVYPGLCVTGRYVLSRDTERHHGNGLKAMLLPDGRVAVAVADTGRHGASAATGTVRLLAVLRGQLESGADLGAALAAVDRYASSAPYEAGATISVAAISTTDGECELWHAGHPPPWLLDPHATARPVGVPPSRPLGLGGSPARTQLTLGVGDALLLHTDGLLSAARDSRQGSDTLGRLLAEPGVARKPGPMYGDAVAERVLTRMQYPDGFLDDVALVVAQLREPPPSFHFSGSAVVDLDNALHSSFATWLDDLGIGLIDHVALGGALREVVGSVTDHARHHRGPSVFEVEASLGPDAVVRLCVRDGERWRAEDSERGHGLVVAGGLVDQLRLDHRADGTDVVMHQKIGRPVPLLRSQATDGATGRVVPRPAPAPDMTSDVDAGWARVSGSVRDDDVEAFRETVHEATRAGTLSATVDLTQVTRLGRPAVRVLLDYLGRAQQSGVELTVVVGAGSGAQHVLGQTAMPHVVSREEGPRP